MLDLRFIARKLTDSEVTRRQANPGRLLTLTTVVAVGLTLTAGPAQTAPAPDIPPEVDPGTPTYAGSDDPVPDEPVEFDPTVNMLEAIYEADQAAGGDSYWFDRVLERPFLNTQDDDLYTRGRALYMYTHDEDELGFAGAGTGPNGGGGFAYREIIQTGVTDLYTIEIDGVTLDEVTAERRQYPSHWTSVHEASGVSVRQAKFITHNNVAVTDLTVTNTGDASASYTLRASSPIATTSTAGGTELTDTFDTRYDLTTVTARLSGDGFAVSGSDLTRQLDLDPGESATVKVQLGATTAELPQSTTEYEQYREFDPATALATQVEDYNRWWVDNVPYIDVPDENIKKMAYYRTFLNRFNYVDADIPGNDYQYPVSIEGVLGYNNAIQLTQPMHLQDLKWFRDPLYSYGNWVSSGDGNQCTAFHDNPGSLSWGNSMEQYIGREGWKSYQVHGGDRKIVASFARYAECDVEGQLAKFDTNDNYLVEYDSGLYTGNDADTPTLHWAQYRGLPVRQDRAESAYQWAGAMAAKQAYELLGNQAKAAEMEALADNIRNAILTRLWDDSPITDPPTLQPTPATRSAGPDGFGGAIRLGNPEPNQYVDLPDGIVSSVDDATFATWVNWNGGQTWSRIFDFGTGTGTNMFLTPNAGGATGLRFAITTGGSGGEQQVNASQELPTGWQHVAVTLEGTTGTIWLNGQPIATSSNIALNPSSLGNTTNNWIGRSQYADPLLQAGVDEFQIYDRALTQADIQSLSTSPGGSTGGGNVAWYRFDEPAGPDALDSSGNERNATVVTRPEFVGEWPGQVFKHHLVANGEEVQWKDNQNFTPFIEGLVPAAPEYREALRYYADADEFPIMPFYTSNQRDKAMATAVGFPGTNNFSNINSTLQAQLFASALREYPSPYVTAGMYRALLEWLTWTQFIGGDNRYPDNNEFFFNWNPNTRTLGRSGIHHNILGAYNFMIIDDIAGVCTRLDERIELWPIDVGWDRFAVNNLSYHGHDLTVVWDAPGDGQDTYPNAPEGYSAYVDGQRAFTVDRLAHVVWNSRTGGVQVLDGSGARVLFAAGRQIPRAEGISLRDNERIVDMFQKAGVDLTDSRPNLAEGRPVTASFTTTTPALRATAPEFAVDGFTMAGLPAQASGGYVAPNTIWGTEGSPNAEDSLAVDLGRSQSVDTIRLYFLSDKDYEPRDKPDGDTYRQPESYALQYHDGSDWVDVPGQVRTPDAPLPNLNTVTFPSITTDRIRVVVDAVDGYGAGLEEIQILGR